MYRRNHRNQQRERILGLRQPLLSVRPLWLDLQSSRFTLAHCQKGLIPLWRRKVIVDDVRWREVSGSGITYSSDDPAQANLEAQGFSLLFLSCRCRTRTAKSLQVVTSCGFLTTEEKECSGCFGWSLTARHPVQSYLWECWCQKQFRLPENRCTSSSQSRLSLENLSYHPFSTLTWCTSVDPIKSRAGAFYNACTFVKQKEACLSTHLVTGPRPQLLSWLLSASLRFWQL